LYHADEMPQVKVQAVKARDLGGGISEVTAIIENARLIPTHSVADIKRKITPPDKVFIEGMNLRVLSGLRATEPFFKDPVEQKRNPSQMKLDTIPGHGVMYVRWFVAGAGPYTVTVNSV